MPNTSLIDFCIKSYVALMHRSFHKKAVSASATTHAQIQAVRFQRAMPDCLQFPVDERCSGLARRPAPQCRSGSAATLVASRLVAAESLQQKTVLLPFGIVLRGLPGHRLQIFRHVRIKPGGVGVAFGIHAVQRRQHRAGTEIGARQRRMPLVSNI